MTETEVFNEFMNQLIDLMTDERPNVAPAAGQLLQALLGPERAAEVRHRIAAELDRRGESDDEEQDNDVSEDDVDLMEPEGGRDEHEPS